MIGYLEDAEHWMLLYGYAQQPDKVFVADPRPGLGCEEPWHEYGERLGGFAMICSSPETKSTFEDVAEKYATGEHDQMALPFGNIAKVD